MDSRIGLDYIVENPEYTAKLAGGECCWNTGSWERWEDTGSWERWEDTGSWERWEDTGSWERCWDDMS